MTPLTIRARDTSHTESDRPIHPSSTSLHAIRDGIFAVQRTQGGNLQQLRPEQRLDQMKVEITERFESICRDMSGEEFAKLVDEMARFRLKYEDLEAKLAQRSLNT
jgi:hypothetical protein